MALAPAVTALRAKAKEVVTFLPVVSESEDYKPPRAPWCLIEIVGGDNPIRGVGVKGDTLYGQEGLIRAFVHVPKGSGEDVGLGLADQIGEALMRLKIAAPAAPDYVETEQPRVDDGVSFDTRGVYAVTMVTIPFTFWHRR